MSSSLGRIATAILFSGFFPACAPRPLWTAKSPDRRHTVTIPDKGPGQSLYLDGRKLGRYEGVAISTFTFDPGGTHWAFAARRGSRWELHSSSGDQGVFDGIGDIRFSASGASLAFEAEQAGKWRVIVNGRAGPRFDALVRDALAFSPDGAHCAYAAVSQGKTAVFLDHKAYPDTVGYAGIGKLLFDSQGRLAFAARRQNSALVVWDGREGPASESISDLTLSGDAGPAYLARRGGAAYLVALGTESGPYIQARNLVASRDGLAHAFAISEPDGEAVVVKGIIGPKFTSVSSPALSWDGKHWAYTARAEKSWQVIVDGRAVAGEEWAGPPALGLGNRLAYAARRAGHTYVVVDGKAWEYALLLDDTVLFGEDGSHWGCIAGRASDHKMFFVIDGKYRRPLDLEEVAGVAIRMPGNGEKDLLKEWVRAELKLAKGG